MVGIPSDCNECLRMLGLYHSNGVMDDVVVGATLDGM